METFETPQPVQPTESKSTDWIKITLAAVLGFGLLAGSAYAGYWYGTQQVQPVEEPTPIVSQPQPEADRPLDETPKTTPTPTPEPTPIPVPSTPSSSELISLVAQHKTRIIENSGTLAVDVEIKEPEPFYDDIYTVSFAYLDEKGNYIPTEGGYVLVGKAGSKWVVGFAYDENYCRWLKESNVDEATRAFMGYESCD